MIILLMFIFPERIIEQAHQYDLPRAYQYNNTLHSAYYNIAGSLDQFGNGNREFPWDQTGGLIHPIKTDKFIHLPGPVVWYKEKGIIRWVFPTGTIFTEKLKLRSGVVFQVRVREKVGKEWAFHVLQPFNSLEALNERVISPIKEELKEYIVQGTVFRDTVHILPEIIEANFLLNNTKFEDVFGSIWTPNTLSDNSIVPRDNILFIVKDSCVSCHKNTSLDVNVFDRSRDWYGNIRGDDQIFSWYPFDPSCISHNGFSKKIIMSTKYDIEKYDPEVHEDYFQTGGYK